MDLAYDLAYNKGIAQNKLPPINPVSMDSLNLNTYRSPAEFAKIKGFNNHIFYLFDFCKYTQVTDGKSQNLYSPTYKGAENGIRAALADRNLYTELKNWFTKRNHFELEAGFLKDLVKESVPSTHVKKVAPVLK